MSQDDSKNDLVLASEGAFNEEDPRALVNLLPASIKECLLGTKNFFLQDMSEESVRKNIRHMQEYQTLKKLRQSFWIEYERANDHQRPKMEMTRIWQGVTENSGEFYKLMKRPEFASYVFTRPIQHAVYDREVQELGRERMIEILSVSPILRKTLPDGTEQQIVDARLAKVQFEIFKHADERVQGGTVKKINVVSEQKNLNVNVDTKNTNVHLSADEKLLDFANANELLKQLKELREKTADMDVVTTTYVVSGEDDEQ